MTACISIISILYSDCCYYKELQVFTVFLTNEGKLTYHVNDEYSLNTNNLILVTALNNNYTVYSDSNKDITDILNHKHIYDVSSSYSNGYLSGELFQDHCCNYKRLLVKYC